jgi:hypothetical protein
MVRITIERNRIRGAGTLPGQGGGYGMLLSTMQSSVVRNNWLADLRYGGIQLYVQTGTTGAGDTVAQDVGIYHNSVSMTATTASWALRIQGTLGSGIDVRDNILSNALRTALSKDVATSAGNLQINNNLYYTPGSSTSISWNGANVPTSGGIGAIRQSMTGVIGGEAAGAYGDPLFTSPGLLDLRLKTGSPAVLLGAGVGVAQDFLNSPRNAQTPTAGAYE